MANDEIKSQKQFPNIFSDKKECCGCNACKSICPVNAITMNIDENGFLYPFIDRDKCIKCYRCIRVCPLKK